MNRWKSPAVLPALPVLALAAWAAAPAVAGAKRLPLPLDIQSTELLRLGKSSARQAGAAIPDFFDARLKPFYHGVASGDPLADRVILWTRVTPEAQADSVAVSWAVSEDTLFGSGSKQGVYMAKPDRDFTVKVDVTGLKAGTAYYYRFTSGDAHSLLGRTKTAPVSDPGNLRFAVTSCANYQAGYFNAYASIAKRKDLDAVLSLGDYFYEYEQGGYGYSQALGRGHEPETEILTLEDYRTRHSFYKLDPDLRAAHQQNPWIVIWDDHESANDAHKDGAENHSDSEGSWAERKAGSIRAYFEWMPIRENIEPPDRKIHRKLSYGSLADFFLLDTRLEGRDKQASSLYDSSLLDSSRTMLGPDQREWLLEGLKASAAKWKVIGNQVIFSPLNVGFAAGFMDVANPGAHITNLDSIKTIESLFLDIWDGYPAERSRILKYLQRENIANTVFLTGDFHSSFAFDVVDTPATYPNPQAFNLPTPSPTYAPATGAGSVAVEFAVPSVTSANFDENLSPQAGAAFEASMNTAIPVPVELPFPIIYNPHMKFVDLDRHGYYLLSLDSSKAQADYFFVPSLTERNSNAVTDSSGAWMTRSGANHLVRASAPYPDGDGANLAPVPADLPISLRRKTAPAAPLSLLRYGWSQASLHLHFSMGKPGTVSIELADLEGKIKINRRFFAAAGLYQWKTNTAGLAAGNYLVRIGIGRSRISKVIRIGAGAG